MYTLLNVSSEKQLEEQKILEELNNKKLNEELINVIEHNSNRKQIEYINQEHTPQNTTNDNNIEKTKDEFHNNNSEKEIKLENKIIKKEFNSIIEKSQNENLLNRNIIIQNSYELTLNLLNTLKHINEAEFLLKKHNKVLNKAMQDILHKIESDKFNVVEGYKLAKKIQIIRNEKRLIKDNLIIYKQLNSLDIFNKETIKKINEIINGVEKDIDVTYEPKILKDLNFRYDNEKIYNKFDDIKKENFINLGIEDF